VEVVAVLTLQEASAIQVVEAVAEDINILLTSVH
jgi:hypothetical protein